MKALLSISCGCVLAVLTPGPRQATAAEVELPRLEAALDAPDNGLAPPTITGNATAPPAPPKSAPAPGAPVSENVTINLINRLVQRGVLTKDDAEELIKQAEGDAVQARAQTSVRKP